MLDYQLYIVQTRLSSPDSGGNRYFPAAPHSRVMSRIDVDPAEGTLRFDAIGKGPEIRCLITLKGLPQSAAGGRGAPQNLRNIDIYLI